MGVYHDANYVNYKTYLTFDENGKEQWSEPEPYLSAYRTTESKYQMCEIGMFRSPDGKRIVLYPHPVEGIDPLSLSLYQMLDEAIERGKLELPELESDEIGGKALE